jgi:hypothetical protein
MRALGYITAVISAALALLVVVSSTGRATVPEDQEDVNRPGRPRADHHGRAPGPGAAAGAPTAGQDRGGATVFRCRGCGAAAVFVQRGRRYGRLVQGFFDQHERCGGAVDISAARPPAVTPG